MQLLESKSLLAKLMATENLHIEQRNVQTASFDVKNRVLTVPVLDNNISAVTYDLFMGHEVGHALWTPLEGMMKARDEKINPGVINVVEDARIERKIKNKYPGLRNSFTKAYRELVDKDFFGTKGADLNEMNFIDRANLHFKGGAGLAIKFTDQERGLVNDMDRTETYEDVLEVSKRIIDYMKEQLEEQKAKLKMMPQEPDDSEDDEYGEYDGLNEFDFDEEDFEESDNLKGNPKAESGEVDAGEESPVKEEMQSNRFDNGDEDVSEQIRSFTDEAYKENEKKLFAENAREYVYANLPKIDLKKAILPYKKLYAQYRADGHGVRTNDFMKIRREANKVVSYLVKEFEMRKNADQLKRASIAKTGELNMSKIYTYQFSEDIFKKITVLPGGKSHGLVMFVDWSGSMANHLDNTIKQLISLVLFCKKVSIPFEVYAFAENSMSEFTHYDQCKKEGDLHTHHFALLNLLSSRMSAMEFTYACSALVYLGRYPRYCPTWMQLSSTPLNESIIAAMDIIPQFQKDNKLQIVNTVFLTDGEGHSLYSINRVQEDGIIRPTNAVKREYGFFDEKKKKTSLIVRDPITKHEEIIEEVYSSVQQTSAYVKLLKLRTGCNVVGFYVLSGREFKRAAAQYLPPTVSIEDMHFKFRKEKSLVINNGGFDEYYFLRSESLDTDADDSFEVKENATTRGLVSAFTKYAGGRVANRVILNRFIGLIA
jgi:hypothetical protein